MRPALLCPALLLVCAAAVADEPAPLDTSRGDRLIAEYFRRETRRIADAELRGIRSLDDWRQRRTLWRQQLLEMLGLDPLPEKTPLKAQVTGRVEHPDCVVEKVHFQSRPGLYVTANLYLPRKAAEPLPAILYVCGHGAVKRNGISYGNKVTYQHHGAWFARHGFACLTLDTLQLGEIEGIHHGTYRYDMWWWLCRGYTPAGVEAWNCVRALDYLESRPEIDPKRLGVTGRSGGGAYSWWIAAIDDRIRAAVPVAGMTDLRNHVVDGCVEGHCDCMYLVNTYRWDYPRVAALVAPRPLLISNTDRDRIFPLDGVVRTHGHVRRIYELHDASENLALQITAGPHADTQELRIHAFRWFNHHLRDDDSLISKPAEKFFTPEQLKVFDELPADEWNTRIHERFVAAAELPDVPPDAAAWTARRERVLSLLREKTFGGWPSEPAELDLKEALSVTRHGIRLRAYDFMSQEAVPLRLYVAHRAGLEQPSLAVLNVLDKQGWGELLATLRPAFAASLASETLPPSDEQAFARLKGMFSRFDWVMAYVAPRGVGPTAWDQSEKKQVQHRRRFYLLGQSLDGMRVWDVRRALAALREVPQLADVPHWLQASRGMAGVAVYAAIFEPQLARLDLHEMPATHRQGPYLLNVRRFTDLPEAVALVAEHSRVVLYTENAEAWHYPSAVVRQRGWDSGQLQLRRPPPKD